MFGSPNSSSSNSSRNGGIRTTNLCRTGTTSSSWIMSASSVVGSSLAEEWMMQPISILPSFIEMNMMDSVYVSFVSFLRTIVENIQTKLHQHNTNNNNHHHHRNRNFDSAPTSNSSSSSSSRTTTTTTTEIHNRHHHHRTGHAIANRLHKIYFVLRAWIDRIRFGIGTNLELILERFGIEVRYLLLYLIQRTCLLSSSRCAKLEEVMYNTRRLKFVRKKVLLTSNNDNNNDDDDCSNRSRNNYRNINNSTTSSSSNNSNADTTLTRSEVMSTNETNTTNYKQQQQKYDSIMPTTTTTTTYTLVPLTKVDQIRLALLSTFGLYIREKLDDYYCKQQQNQQQQHATTTTIPPQNTNSIKENDTNDNDKKSSTYVKIVSLCHYYFIQYYPYLMSSIDLYSVWCHMQYLLGRSLQYDLTSWLLGQLVIRQQVLTQTNNDTKSNLAMLFRNNPNHPNVDRTTTASSSSLSSPNTTIRSAPVAATATTSNAAITTATTTTIPLRIAPKYHDRMWLILQKAIWYTAGSLLVLGWITKVRTEWYEYDRYQQQQLHQQQQQRITSRRRRRRRDTNEVVVSNDDVHVDDDDDDDDEDEEAEDRTTDEWRMVEMIPPPPPQAQSKHATTRLITRSSSTTSSSSCPLCHRPRRIHPTALSLSGSVFCYTCIRSYLKEYGLVCPVTGRRAATTTETTDTTYDKNDRYSMTTATTMIEPYLVRLYEPTTVSH